MKINQLKIDLQVSYKEDQKMTTVFEPIIIEDVVNKA